MRKLIVAIAFVLVLGACDVNPFVSDTTSTYTPVPERTAYVFGDSNIYLAHEEVDALYPPDLATHTHGVGGDKITTPDWAATRIAADLGSLPSTLAAVVVQLGTNDCRPPAGVTADVTGVAAGIDAIMAKFPSTVKVHWNNVDVPLGNYYCLAVNVLLGQATARWSNLVIEDFHGHIASNSTYVPGPDPHMTQAGQNEYAAWSKSYVLAGL